LVVVGRDNVFTLVNSGDFTHYHILFVKRHCTQNLVRRTTGYWLEPWRAKKRLHLEKVQAL